MVILFSDWVWHWNPIRYYVILLDHIEESDNTDYYSQCIGFTTNSVQNYGLLPQSFYNINLCIFVAMKLATCLNLQGFLRVAMVTFKNILL